MKLLVGGLTWSFELKFSLEVLTWCFHLKIRFGVLI